MKLRIYLIPVIVAVLFSCGGVAQQIEPNQGESVVIVGTGMASRMSKFGHFETEIYLSFPSKDLQIRNMADEGNTPASDLILVGIMSITSRFLARRSWSKRIFGSTQRARVISRRPTNG